MDARRLAYLDAMGIDVWRPRREPLAAAPIDAMPGFVLGDGDGDILCIAGSAAEAGLKLASDISRAMRNPPVWAWPVRDAEGEGEGMKLVSAIAERLFTRVLVFGQDLAGAVLGESAPEVISGARVHVVPGLERLAGDQDAKRILWAVMCEHGIAAPRNSGSNGS